MWVVDRPGLLLLAALPLWITSSYLAALLVAAAFAMLVRRHLATRRMILVLRTFGYVDEALDRTLYGLGSRYASMALHDGVFEAAHDNAFSARPVAFLVVWIPTLVVFFVVAALLPKEIKYLAFGPAGAVYSLLRGRAYTAEREEDEFRIDTPDALEHLRSVLSAMREPRDRAVRFRSRTVARVADALWQDTVRLALENVDAVVIDASAGSPSVLWELGALAQSPAPAVVLLNTFVTADDRAPSLAAHLGQLSYRGAPLLLIEHPDKPRWATRQVRRWLERVFSEAAP